MRIAYTLPSMYIHTSSGAIEKREILMCMQAIKDRFSVPRNMSASGSGLALASYFSSTSPESLPSPSSGQDS